jgi:hypothetical protein
MLVQRKKAEYVLLYCKYYLNPGSKFEYFFVEAGVIRTYVQKMYGKTYVKQTGGWTDRQTGQHEYV